MSSIEELYQIADELRAIACLGRRFAENHYDVERYEQVLAATARLIAVLEQRSPDEVLTQFQDNLLHVSPLAGAEVAVVRDDQILLIRREDDGVWALPGGLVEVGETLAQAAQRELWEETSVRGHVTQLLGIFDSRLCQSRTKAQLYHAVFLVDAENAQPHPGPETTDAAFFKQDALPPFSPGHHIRVPFVFRALRGEATVPFFDPADQDVFGDSPGPE
jgi:ADP-ribose pyrophosphatase YjhB (NUDIX family)